VLNVGGGTVGDLGGFVAALYLRGIRYIHVPTTLLSQADSGVGGKVNVNFGPHLNSLSVFHHPTAVWIDPDVLETLPAREYLSGLAEIVKYAVVLDAELFVILEQSRDRLAIPTNELVETVICRCLQRKCIIVSRDPREEGPFRFFNYGHEIGHAVEVAYDYEHLLHGEAVSIGMVAASWMGVKANVTDTVLFERQCVLLADLGLPITIPANLRKGSVPHRLVRRIKHVLDSDKKRTPKGSVWIVPTRLGEAVCTTEIGPDLVTRCLRRVANGAIDG
jgi:3-dehydroquinate synthase